MMIINMVLATHILHYMHTPPRHLVLHATVVTAGIWLTFRLCTTAEYIHSTYGQIAYSSMESFIAHS